MGFEFRVVGGALPSRGCRGQVGAPRCVAHHARLSAKGRECPHGGFRLQGSRACLVTSHGGSRASPWKRGAGTRSFGGDDLRAEGSGGTENVRWRGGRQLVPVRCHRPPSTEKYARGAGRLRHLFSDEAGFRGPAVPRRQGRGWGGSTLGGRGRDTASTFLSRRHLLGAAPGATSQHAVSAETHILVPQRGTRGLRSDTHPVRPRSGPSGRGGRGSQPAAGGVRAGRFVPLRGSSFAL